MYAQTAVMITTGDMHTKYYFYSSLLIPMVSELYWDVYSSLTFHNLHANYGCSIRGWSSIERRL